MTINCIRKRVLILKKLWNIYHDNKQTEIDDLQKEIYDYDNQQ